MIFFCFESKNNNPRNPTLPSKNTASKLTNSAKNSTRKLSCLPVGKQPINSSDIYLNEVVVVENSENNHNNNPAVDQVLLTSEEQQQDIRNNSVSTRTSSEQSVAKQLQSKAGYLFLSLFIGLLIFLPIYNLLLSIY